MDSGKPCPLDGSPSEVLATTNEWCYLCPTCGNRFNDQGEIRPLWDDESLEEPEVEER